MLCSGDMFKLYYRLVFVESSRLSWSTKVLTEAKNLGTFHIFKNSAILRKCCYGFKLSSPVSSREPMTCEDVIQLCRLHVVSEIWKVRMFMSVFPEFLELLSFCSLKLTKTIDLQVMRVNEGIVIDELM